MIERFDDAAKTWDERPGRLQMASKFADEIKKHLNPELHFSAMEFGCGTANVSLFLKDYFKEIVLADASQGMLNEVRKKLEKIGAGHLKPTLINIEKETVQQKFDVIYTLMTLHHVKDVETVLGKISNMLNPKGLLIIGDLDKEDGNFHKYPENQEVHCGFEKEYLKNILVKSNLEVKDYTIFHQLERDHTGTPVVYPLFALVVVAE